MSPMSISGPRRSFGTPTLPTGPAADRQVKSPDAARRVEYRDDHEDDANMAHYNEQSRDQEYRGRANSGFDNYDQGHGGAHVMTDSHDYNEEPSRRERSRSPYAYADNHMPEVEYVNDHEPGPRDRSPSTRGEKRNYETRYHEHSHSRHRSRSPYARGEKSTSDHEYVKHHDSRHRSRSSGARGEKHTSEADYVKRRGSHTEYRRTKSKRESSRDRGRRRDELKSSGRRSSRRDREKERDRSRSPRRESKPIPTGPAPKEFKIQGQSKRSGLELQKEIVREEKPNLDVHALEREARNRERISKEQERRNSYMMEESNTAHRGRKRDHAAVEEDDMPQQEGGERRGRHRKARGDGRDRKRGRKSKVSEDWDDENVAAQERAREAERWK